MSSATARESRARPDLRTFSRSIPTWALVAIVTLCYLTAGWSGMTRLGDSGAYDSAAFKDYAEILDRLGRLPTEAENYEYTLPPAYPLLGAYLDRAVRRVDVRPGRPLEVLPGPVRRGIWLVLATASILALATVRRRSPAWWGGLAGAAVAAAWAGAYVLTYVADQPWAAKVLMTLALTAVLVVLAAVLAREALPERRWAPVVAAAATAFLPATMRIGVVFHPDPLFATLALCAFLLVLRAAARTWPLQHAIGIGALLGLAALTRQSALVIVVSVVAVALLLGRRRALGFLGVVLAATALTAGPWWGYQASRFGNPIQSNLDRPGYMLERQPLSFFVSLPLPDLITRPYRESFKNELLPKFHAELWSDWFGAVHDWVDPSRANRVLASTQSVLGLGGDALVLWGLFAAGVPATRRALRAPPATRQDAALVAMTTLFVLSWLAFVAMLLRFPQADGDPIQAHYLLFLGPVSCVFGVIAAMRAWRRGTAWRAAVLGWAALYSISYAATLWTAF